PRHPYTRALISAAPLPDPSAKRERIVLEGDVPSPMTPPTGCHFHTRCPFAVARCREEYPAPRAAGPQHHFACHLDLYPNASRRSAGARCPRLQFAPWWDTSTRPMPPPSEKYLTPGPEIPARAPRRGKVPGVRATPISG